MNEQGINGSHQDKPQEAETDIFGVEAERPAVVAGIQPATNATGAQDMVSEHPAKQVSTAQIKQTPSKHKSTRKEKKCPKSIEIKKSDVKGLSPREIIALREIVNGETRKDALITAGYSETTATKNPIAVLGKVGFVRALLRTFERLGMTEDAIVLKHKELMDCKKVVPIGAGDYDEVEDGQTQIKAVELAYKIRGDFAPELHAITTETYGQRIKRLRGEKAE